MINTLRSAWPLILSYLTTTMGLQRHYWAVWVLFAVSSFICEASETVKEAGKGGPSVEDLAVVEALKDVL